MDRYQKVEKPKTVLPISENEIRITSQGLIKNYLIYATTLLRDKTVKEIVLKAMGQAINKTVAIAEILKRRIPNLHQDNAVSSISITDTWEPIEDGLLPVEMTRYVSMISVTLSTRELNKNSPGYRAPQFVEQQKSQYQYYQQQPRQPRGQYNAVNEDSYGRGRGRGGRGMGKSLSRGVYGDGNYQDNGGYYPNWNRGGGRGSGWAYNDNYQGTGNFGGRGGEGRGYGRGRGRMVGVLGGKGRGSYAYSG